MSWEQRLVNAQLNVNRAVWMMNARWNPETMKHTESDPDAYIKKCIEEAIEDLRQANPQGSLL